MKNCLILILFCAFGIFDGLAQCNIDNKISESWVATDRLGRQLPNFYEVGSKREDKIVAMFYWSWHVMDRFINKEPINVDEVLKKHPDAIRDFNHSAWTRMGRHHWSEPLFGYYVSTDEWVMMKHAIMLADAGVDVVFFDCTNATFMWDEGFETLGKVWSKAKENDIDVPKFAFMCPFTPLDNSRVLVEKIYNRIYKVNKYKDLWFYWEGKPMIMTYPDNIKGDIKDYFTFRAPQPLYRKGPKRKDHWGWSETYPQHGFGKKENGQYEQVTVSVAQNATDDLAPAAMNAAGTVYGRSYTHSKISKHPENSVEYGYNFQEQFDHALEIDPQLIFVTGWNEWTVGRHKEWQGTENAFPDQFNQEYSRDIEPMKGGHADTYYYQLVSNIRKFKGLNEPPVVSAPMTIKMDGNFNEWNDILPEYHDHKDLVYKRNHRGYGSTWYKNNTGTNDIIKAKVARDEEYVYFYVETVDYIDQSIDNWMSLYIDIDKNKTTGWEGYDFVINRTKQKKGKIILEKHKANYDWNKVCVIDCVVRANKMELAIPKKHLTNKDIDGFEFKWIDDIDIKGDIMKFYLDGDVAPSGRFNYFYYCQKYNQMEVFVISLSVLVLNLQCFNQV